MKRYGILAALGICIIGLMGCNDAMDTYESAEATPINLSGTISNGYSTRADEEVEDGDNSDASTDLPMTFTSLMRDVDGNPIFHFAQYARLATTVLADNGIGKVSFVQDKDFPSYPMAGQFVRMILHTRTSANPREDYAEDNRKLLNLKAGRDYLLGNNATGNKDTESANIRLHHIMTRIVVQFTKADDFVKLPESASFTLKDKKVLKEGTFPIDIVIGDKISEADEAIKATAKMNSGDHVLGAGENFVLATGENLTGTGFSSITIDDYTLNATDLAKLFVPKGENKETEMILNPGLSYTLTFHVNILGLAGLSIHVAPWDVIDVTTPEADHTAQRIHLSLGDYEKEDLEKIVVFDEENNKYTAEIDKEYPSPEASSNRTTNSVQLPNNIVKAELYTSKGMIISTTNITYTESVLTIGLSKSGMLPVDPSAAYDATNNPYAVTTPIQLFKIEDLPDASFRQTADLDLCSTANNSIGGAFTGRFDGNSKYISNLLLNDNGLFEHNIGVIENVHLKSGLINVQPGATHAGSIAAINSGKIIACNNNARIKSTSVSPTYIGGICGKLSGELKKQGLVIGCLQSATITAANGVAAGIVGQQIDNKSLTTACINVGKMSAPKIAGICGSIESYSLSNIEYCYWLAGTATAPNSDEEVAVIGYEESVSNEKDICALSTYRLRETETIDRLNDVLLNNEISTYTFKLSVWPTAVVLID